ncbi:MAG: hypothetical protein ACKOYM_01140 [Actinomycetes bacterium]
MLRRSTYGIWWLAAAFGVLAIGALAAVLVLGSRESETVQLPGARPATTLPGAPPTSAASGGSGSASSVSPTPTVTVPGGAPAPAGVTKVLATPGSTSFSFSVPPSLRDERVRAAVPPAEAVPVSGGRQLQVTINCVLVTDEVLAQLSVSEGDTVVTVLPVVLIPQKGSICRPGTVLTKVTVPLASPLGSRQIFVAPTGTPVPTPG